MQNEANIDRARRSRKGKSRRRASPKGKIIRRRMGSSGVRCILVRPGKPARIVKCR